MFYVACTFQMTSRRPPSRMPYSKGERLSEPAERPYFAEAGSNQHFKMSRETPLRSAEIANLDSTPGDYHRERAELPSTAFATPMMAQASAPAQPSVRF